MIRVTPEGFIDYTAPDGWARSYPPGSDLTGAPEEVVKAAKKVWTKAVLKQHQPTPTKPKARAKKKAALKPRRT